MLGYAWKIQAGADPDRSMSAEETFQEALFLYGTYRETVTGTPHLASDLDHCGGGRTHGYPAVLFPSHVRPEFD